MGPNFSCVELTANTGKAKDFCTRPQEEKASNHLLQSSVILSFDLTTMTKRLMRSVVFVGSRDVASQLPSIAEGLQADLARVGLLADGKVARALLPQILSHLNVERNRLPLQLLADLLVDQLDHSLRLLDFGQDFLFLPAGLGTHRISKLMIKYNNQNTL